MYWIPRIDQPKTFTSLLKSNFFYFETLGHVHVYCIEYVSYRQGSYRMRIDTVADCIVPALLFSKLSLGLKFKKKTDHL